MRTRASLYEPPVLLECDECGVTFSVPAAWARKGRRFCSRDCKVAVWTLPKEAVFDLPVVSNTDGCRLLVYRRGPLAGQPRSTYLYIGRKTRHTVAHRIVWEVTHGQSVPIGLLVRHLCPGGGNAACIEPTHLGIGTHQDNRDDAVRAGRVAAGDRNGARMKIERMPRGSSHGRAILTEADILEIRRLYIRGDHQYGVEALAKQYGVGATTVGHIVAGRTWKHVS
jgi:hypothetical protein